eukprot:GHVU01127947.1.p4 GENE.GHVU01127947.1~~GHVU01127947.1.p4  ORF type:complete len:116 (-),score=8.70 GHVU01127947.1:165-512(-)
MHIHTYTQVHIYMHTHVHTHIHTYIHTHTHTHWQPGDQPSFLPPRTRPLRALAGFLQASTQLLLPVGAQCAVGPLRVRGHDATREVCGDRGCERRVLETHGNPTTYGQDRTPSRT